MTSPWVERVTADGSSTLAHGAHGETFHSMSGAWTQARERYATECRLRERALELARSGATTFWLLDIGTGLGLNLAAALEALDGTGVVLEATSFERDAELLAHVVATRREPADLERWHEPVRTALASALARRDTEPVPLANGRLRLVLGDARTQLEALHGEVRFDAVFLDPFSPRVEPDLWSRGFLAVVASRMAPGSRLSTYSAATEVRLGLLDAGLRVGRGARVGEKREGTVASPDLDLPEFDPGTARRLAARSRADTKEGRFGAQAEDPRGSMP